MWGLNAVGPFRTAPGGYKHILVAVDKFTKWIKVRPVAKVTSEEAVKFIGDIKHRFSVPNRIIADLGKAFTGSVFGDCRMDLPGPTTSVGTRTDYSVGPWDYPACATRHLMAWSTRTTEEKYSVRKLYMSCAVWKTPRRTRLVLSPYSDL
jgi:hypothetical protein